MKNIRPSRAKAEPIKSLGERLDSEMLHLHGTTQERIIDEIVAWLGDLTKARKATKLVPRKKVYKELAKDLLEHPWIL